jgi:membrane protein DedA with SNARE-associated domain
MDWLTTFLQNIVDFTATLDPKTALLLLIICTVGEAGLTVPLLLEFIWLNVGMYLGNGQLSFWHMLGLWFSAQAGRQIGAVILYRIGRFGLPAMEKFYHKIHLDRLFDRLMSKAGAIKKINLTSPFSVAFGRLVGMRIPMTLVLAAKKKPWMLAAGVFMASMVFDGLYIFAGAVLGLTIDDVKQFNPLYTVLITVSLMLAIYLITFLVRLIIKRRKKALQPINDENDENPWDENV